MKMKMKYKWIKTRKLQKFIVDGHAYFRFPNLNETEIGDLKEGEIITLYRGKDNKSFLIKPARDVKG